MSHEITTDQLSSLQQRAVQLLLSGSNVSSVARDIGVDRTTIYNWRKGNPDFSRALNQTRSLQTRMINDSMRELANAAVDTLREILLSSQVPVAVRLRAAQTVLNQQPAHSDVDDGFDVEEIVVEPMHPSPNSPQISTQFDTMNKNPYQQNRQERLGRNTPCLCGSGLKFKRCCGNPISAPLQKAA